MKRRSDSSRHATMRGFQFRKGFDCLGVADHAGNRTSAGGVGGLPLGGGLWLRHSGGQKFVRFHDFGAREKFSVMNVGVGCHELQDGILPKLSDCGWRCADASSRPTNIDCAGSNCGGFGDVHFVLPAEPIPTMLESLHVTSDASTAVYRVAA